MGSNRSELDEFALDRLCELSIGLASSQSDACSSHDAGHPDTCRPGAYARAE